MADKYCSRNRKRALKLGVMEIRVELADRNLTQPVRRRWRALIYFRSSVDFDEIWQRSTKSNRVWQVLIYHVLIKSIFHIYYPF